MSKQQESTPKVPTWEEFQNGLIARALKDESFRRELLANPKAVMEKEMSKLKEGVKLPEAVEVKVIEQPANTLCLVLPSAFDELTDEALDNVAGGKWYHYLCGTGCNFG